MLTIKFSTKIFNSAILSKTVWQKTGIYQNMLNEWAVDDEATFVEVGVGGEVAVALQALKLHVVEVGHGRVFDVATDVDHLKYEINRILNWIWGHTLCHTSIATF